MYQEKPSGHLLWILFAIILIWGIFLLTMTGSKVESASNFLILNTLFTGLAFGGALINIIIQMNQIAKQNKESDKKRFEDLFYNILKINNDMANQLNTDPAGKNLKGRACFTWFYGKLNGYLDGKIKEEVTNSQIVNTEHLDVGAFNIMKVFAVTRDFNWGKAESVASYFKSNPGASLDQFKSQVASIGQAGMAAFFKLVHANEDDLLLHGYYEEKFRKMDPERRLKIIRDAYDEFFENNEHEIGYYFRNLFYSLQFLRHSSMKRSISNHDEEHFSKVLRAGLSKFEIIMIYYNCLTEYSSYEFNDLVGRYHIIDEIDKGRFHLYETDSIELFKCNTAKLKERDERKG